MSIQQVNVCQERGMPGKSRNFYWNDYVVIIEVERTPESPGIKYSKI
jgi:hypothetical protein